MACALALCLALALGWAGGAGAATQSASSLAPPPTADQGAAAERLALEFAPITMVREQRHPPCDTTEEQYEPTTVDAVLGNPTVLLERELDDGSLEAVQRAPTTEDVAGLASGYYLNLNGTVLGKTCVYSRDFRKLVDSGRAPPTTYAHIAREPGYEGFALQYWFFWYFNQFNDLHEGDWEGMQITFEASTPAEALRSGEEPSQIILFQHAGGERADWDEPKVKKEGSHPVVYPAAGSHATFYDSAVYVENGQNGSGLGCDNTSEPVREIRPQPVLLPAEAPLTGEFAWLSYEGRWGEREKGYNNGPTGPATKTVWAEPFSWMAAQRSTSPRLPGGSLVGPEVSKAFCGAVTAVTDLMNLDAKSRPAAAATVAAALLVVVLFFVLTKWSPVDLNQLRARRRFGQLLRTARRLYGRHWKVLVAVAALAIPLVGGVNLLAGLISGGGGVDEVTGRGGFNLAIADLLTTLVRPVASAVVMGFVIVLVRLLVESRQATLRDSWHGLRERFWRVVGAQLLATLGILALALTVVGIPVAIYKFFAWSFVQQEVLFADKSIRGAFRGSSDIVRGRWWRTVRVALFMTILSVVAGPLLTFALIFTSMSLVLINLLGSVVFALMIPYVALGYTLLYFDLQVRGEEEGFKPRRSWKPWRPRQFGRVLSGPVAGPAAAPRPAPP